jgi:O-antigen/teichoic acid export membrane protein
MQDLKGRVIRGGFAKLCGRVASIALRIVSMVVLARLLTPEDFGLVAMVTVVTGIYQMFATAGLSSATIQKSIINHEQISTLFWINLLVGIILALICVVTAPVLVTVYDEPRLFWMTVVMATAFPISAAAVQHSALLERELRYVALTVIETVSMSLSIAIGIGMALRGFEYWAILGMNISAAAIYTIFVWASAPWVPGRPRRSVEIRSMLSFGGTVTLNAVVVHFAYNLDKVLIGRYWGADALGIYERASRLINVPTGDLNSAIGGVAFSALSRLQGDPIRLKSYFQKGYSMVMSMTIPITIFCAVFADDIVAIVLGPQWRDAAIIFRLLSPTILIFGVINPLAWLLWSIGLQVRSLSLALVIAPLVIGAYIIGLPYGPRGVAFCYSVAMSLWLVPHVVWCLHGTMISKLDLFLAAGRPLLSSIVAAAITVGMQIFIGELQEPFVRLLLGGIVMISVYLWFLLFVLGQKLLYVDLIKQFNPSCAKAELPSS